MKGLLRFLFPGGVVLLAAVVAARFVGDATLDLVTGRYGVVLYVAGALLAAAFHRSRVVAALVCFGLLDVAHGGASEPEAFVPLASILMLLLGILTLLRDRGIFSRGGLVQLLGTGLVAYVAHGVLADERHVAAFRSTPLLPPGTGGLLGLPDATILLGGASLVVVLINAYRWRGPVERALLWSEVALAVSVLPFVDESGSAFLLMAAGLVLSISVLETSYFMAYRDELTGLPARRALVRELQQISGTYTVAMVDVDHFKQFNDKFGHDVGDQVLKLVASRLDAGPGGGKAYRYGGEEFTLVYPGRVMEDAAPHVESVRRAVELATFSLRAWNRPRKRPAEGRRAKKKKRPRKLSVTVSIGLADSTRESDPEAILKKADEALYRAKREGRNRVSR